MKINKYDFKTFFFGFLSSVSLEVFLTLIVIFVYKYEYDNNHVFVTNNYDYFKEVKCSNDYLFEINKWPKCVPRKCGRGVSDTLITKEDTTVLQEFAKVLFTISKSAGGAAIVDLHSGAMSNGDKFVNLYKLFNSSTLSHLITPTVKSSYRKVMQLIRQRIVESFDLPTNSRKVGYFQLTKPTFFSHLLSDPPKTPHDEYWHKHIDRTTYGSFHYTSLLYLSSYGEDFKGGRFVFDNSNLNSVSEYPESVVQPKLGRVSYFTSGSENPHNVERVTEGNRYALTIAFTCNPDLGIDMF